MVGKRLENVTELFTSIEPRRHKPNAALHQFFTPEWAAQELVDAFFGDLNASDLVLEPTCGKGSFLKAIPSAVRAIGIEIDPELAVIAQEETGRPVLVGDFREIELPEQPTCIIGNPPFQMGLLDQLLDKARLWLPNNGRCGLILSAYMVQTPNTVLRWNDHWSLDQRILPRTLFPRAIRPLIFLMFTKDPLKRMMGGFALYKEASEINDLAGGAKLLLVHGNPLKNCWRSVVEWGLRKLGGRGHVRELYQVIESKRPSDNRWWQEKIRQTLQRHFTSVERGIWELPMEAA